MVESLTRKATMWWETHQSGMHTWMSSLTYFIKIFGGKKLTVEAKILKFVQGMDPYIHINKCQKEWRILGYKDDKLWLHLFPSTL